MQYSNSYKEDLFMSSEIKKRDAEGINRRHFLMAGAAGAAGIAATGLGMKSTVWAQKSKDKRVAILVDTQTHMMPALAREMARRNHNLVVGNVADGLVNELKDMGAQVEVISGNLDLTNAKSMQKLVKAAQARFGRIDSACVRTGVHGTGDILHATPDEFQVQYEGNMLSVLHALNALLPPMVAQGSGQIVINTSASGLRPAPFAALYSATRAGANALIRCAGLTAAKKGVTVNATGTYAMDYPSFIEDVGADDPQRRRELEAQIPMNRFGKPEEAAHFVATLIDGVGTFQTGQFFAIDGGWAFE
jgi:NAD(P)-dependent dehydrogenase (short-subunit alcohol dehydrogenase family)